MQTFKIGLVRYVAATPVGRQLGITYRGPEEEVRQEQERERTTVRVNEFLTVAELAELIDGVTRLLQETLGKNPATTVVVIDEVEMDNWGVGGLPVEDFRKTRS